MSVERIEAAIAKLEELKAESTRGPWQHQPWGGQNQNGDYSGGDVFDGGGEYLLSEVRDEDGDLIVTLHRTIDAQLAILRAAWSTNDDFEYTRGDYTGRGPLKVHPLGIAAVALADAILGGDAGVR